MTLLEHALNYAARGWPVFALSRSKVPFAGTHGHLDASTDPERVKALFQGRRGANIGLACGQLIVVDCDGPAAYARLKAAAGPYGGLPRTLISQTTREDGGLHFFFLSPPGVELRTRNEPRKHGESGIDLKGAGGYVLLPPSTNKKGKHYKWINETAPVEIPRWLIEFLQTIGNSREKSPIASAPSFGELPAYLRNIDKNQKLVSDKLSDSLAFEHSEHNEARLASALASISPDIGYDEWVRLGMALHHLEWIRPDGTDAGFELWNIFSERDTERYSLAKLETHWKSFVRDQGARSTVGAIFAIAAEHGWSGQVSPIRDSELTASLQANALFAPPAAPRARAIFPDTDKSGAPKATCANARVALRALGIECRHDTFHEKLMLGGHTIAQWAGEFSDNAVQMLRVIIHRQFGFDPGPQNTNDAAIQECLQGAFDPVCDYLNSLKWDGVPRLAHWLSTYLGAEPNALNAEIGRLALVAAVRRAYQPGSKFDQIIVLEGVEGTGKSSAIEILAGAVNFSDQSILGLDDKAQQEAMQGVWLYEIADLAGMSKAEVERVKAFASRKTDRARPAYGRARVDRPRRCIFFATTNNETYLKSQTGNRRFWPVRTGTLQLAALERDRDQLWAEASEIEADMGAVVLNPALWGVMGEMQEARRDHDPWDDILAHIEGKKVSVGLDDEWRITTRDLFELHLRLPADRQNDGAAKRLSYAMRRLGWNGPKTIKLDGKSFKGYARGLLVPTGNLGGSGNL